MAAETTTLINETYQNTTSTDKESEKELNEFISESNTREEEKSSVSVLKSEDMEASVTAAVWGKEAEEVACCRNTESASALSGGVENSVVIESVNVVEDSKDADDCIVKEIDVPGDDVAAAECGGIENSVVVESVNVVEYSKDADDGALKEIDVPSDDVAAVECDGSEVPCTVDVEGQRNGDLEEEIDGEDTGVGEISVGQKDENEGDENETVKEEEGGQISKDEIKNELTDEFKSDYGVNVQQEEVESVQEMVGSDVRNDGGDEVENIDNDQGDDAITEEQVVAEVAKEEEMVAVKEEVFLANEETVDDVSENDEKDTMVEDEEKSLDTEMETEKSVDTEMETEKSLDTEMENEEEANLADEEKVQETEIETEASTKGGGGKRKRGGKSSKATPKASATPRKTIEEDVCFICYDGGDLVLCDRRNCTKAYHPSCVNRDEAFFQSKGQWICGWHLCTVCEKKADYMCYTCTHSLCKACTKTSVILCIREKEKKGLCVPCMNMVMLIEKQDNQVDVNFDDKNSWEHLFKDYWTETKAKHNLSLAELEQAKSPWKGSGKQESLIAQPDIKDDNGSDSDNPPENLKTRKSKRNTKKQKSKKEDDSSTGAAASSVAPGPENADWVSKDLLEFVTHMRNGDSSVISQFEVQDLLLEYIKRNKLRDPNHKSQIICDARLENLFGKPRVAHIEMLKLLESHFLVNEDSQIDDFQGIVVDTEISPADDKDKKRKGRKKSDRRGPQSNREDYAAIDIHNISLIYLRRKLVEDLLDDMERFHGIIVGTFVRIRISGAHQKQDIYRLVQVTGTSEAAWYTLSKRTTCTMLEILNLDKTETISIDSISNQDFMEGDVLDKAMELQVVRVNDWFETEIVRLNHLRDRAKCVEKLSVLKTPEERARRLEEFPLVHDDPTMDPEFGSEDDTDSNDKKQELYKRSDSFRFNRRDYTSKDSWSGTPRGSSGKSHEFTESWSGTPRGSSGRNNEFTESRSGTPRSSLTKNLEFTESWSGTPQSSSSKNYEFTKKLSNKNVSIKAEDAATSNLKVHRENFRDPFVQQPIILEKPSVPSPSIAAESAPKINESEKMWHYKDPSEKIQGPFSMVQLRKWSKNGYFPVGLKIWRKSDKEDDGILLTDALEGKLTVVDLRAASQDGQSLTRDNLARDSRHEPAKFPSPTPNKGTIGWPAGQTGPLTGPSLPSPNNTHLIACGNKDGNLSGSIGVSTNTVSVAVAVAVEPQNVDQCVQNLVQSSELGQPVAPTCSNMQPQMVQSVSGQNPQGWPQNMQPNPSMNMTGLQPLVYNQWTGVPNMVQNPVGNFMSAPQEPWAQQFPFPVNQPNMQQLPQQLQPNVNWGAMPANPNMGWVGPNTGTPMNWAPMVQGPQVTGPVDPNWVMQAGSMQAGWVPQPVQGVVPNQSWVANPVQGPVVAGNGNPSWVGLVPPGAGWVAPNGSQVPPNMNAGWVSGPGNEGAPVPNKGWAPPTGNQGAPPGPPPGNTNQNWGSRNRGGSWVGNENRGRNFSGQRKNRGGYGYGGSRRSFNNRQESFHRDGGRTDKDDEWTHKDSGSFHEDDRRSFNSKQESFHRDGGPTDEDDGSIHKDSGSFHGDGDQ
ncbi:hypothetical protein L1987_38091 [Smallanthus sonchifolius]|uniref:Uncharacterized protein n=1 Tax=Smallanthus sonchifolius TaxID=185202 RepID=A0ACB9HII8_9ASTR|nr:hypothetical protein L1987_38091 [Smallanthus sonchifolius]